MSSVVDGQVERCEEGLEKTRMGGIEIKSIHGMVSSVNDHIHMVSGLGHSSEVSGRILWWHVDHRHNGKDDGV